MQGYISVNGVINPPDQACVPAMDRGFLFGENIFETLVGFSGVVINIPAHLQRMRRSAEMIGLELDLKDEQIQFEIQHIASMLPFAKSLIRLVITGGNGMGLVRPAASPCNRVIYGLKAPELDPLVDTQGYALKQIKLPYTERGGSAKTGNYIRSIKALSQAQKQGFHDIIWENQEGEMTESSVANIFFIGRQGDLLEIVTPPTQSGLLPGITRSTLLQLMEQAQIKAEERIIHSHELARFDEAFLCSTVRGLVPIQRINNHQLYTTRKNATFQHIKRLYHAWITSQLGFQVDWNTGVKR